MASNSFQHPTAVKSQVCYLLSITAEIREKIFAMAVLVPGVYPYERDSSSRTTFTYMPSNVRQSDGEYHSEPLTTALQLGLTCHQLYDEVVATSLFYRVNEFCFYGSFPAIRYLKSVPPFRMNWIASIHIECPFGNNPTQAFNVLSHCQGLKDLTLILYDVLQQGTSAHEALCRIRGLERLTVIYCHKSQVAPVANMVPGHPFWALLTYLLKATPQQWKNVLKGVPAWEALMDVRELTMQERTKKTDKRAATAAAISCYCRQPRVLRFGRGNKCRCQERNHERIEITAWGQLTVSRLQALFIF
jgi:hypothetical protein